MPCQICGENSGRYPLCRRCNERRTSGEVAKCGSCSRWAEVLHGFCRPCLGRELELPGDLVTSWAKVVFRNAAAGAQNTRTDSSFQLFSAARGIAEEIYSIMGAREVTDSRRARAEMLVRWANALSDIGTEGLAGTQQEIEAKRFIELSQVASSIGQRLKEPELHSAKDSMKSERVLSAEEPAVRLVTDREIPQVIQTLIREARQELLIVSPWIKGVDNLLRDLVQSSETVQVRLVTRLPEASDDGHRRALIDLNRDRISMMWSPHVHAKMVIQDGRRALVGSANLMSTSFERNQEAAILTSDENVVAEAQEYFSRLFLQARADMMGLN